MEGQSLQASRRFPRVPAEHRVRIRVRSDRRPDQVSRTRVIGLGGCMLVSENPLGLGTLLELMISLDGRLLLTDARVAWERPAGQAGHDVGVEFLRIRPGGRELLDRLVQGRLSSAA